MTNEKRDAPTEAPSDPLDLAQDEPDPDFFSDEEHDGYSSIVKRRPPDSSDTASDTQS